MSQRHRPPQRSTAPRAASLADVASLAGVSAGTVSRALSRPDMISEATRKRVVAAVEKLGYVTNGAARALAMRRTFTVGAIVPRFGSSSFPTMVQALESTLATEGYTLLLSAPEHSRVQDPALLHALLERGVDAVVLLGAEHPPSVFATLAAHRRPFVLLWTQQSEQGPCVGFDEADAADLLVDHLATLGHVRVGFIGGRTIDNERARRRLRGLTLALARRGMHLVPEALLETEYGFAEGFNAMQAILQKKAQITAVVCGNDYLAAGVLSALSHAGIAVPRDLSVASFNDNDFAAYLYPALTTVRLPIREIGEHAGHIVLASLRGETPENVLLPTQLIVRESTAPPPAT